MFQEEEMSITTKKDFMTENTALSNLSIYPLVQFSENWRSDNDFFFQKSEKKHTKVSIWY